MKHHHAVIYGYTQQPGHHIHTHSYIHRGYVEGFLYLGIPTYWVDPRHANHPEFRNIFKNALVFTEAWTLQNMPLDKSSTYAVHYLGNKGAMEANPGPDYFKNAGVKFFDVRYNADRWTDKNYDYTLDRSKCTKIGSGSYFEKGDNGYDYMYTLFGTDLLPNQINLEDRFITRDTSKYAFFAGTIRPDNEGMVNPFIKACTESGVKFIHNNSWTTPLTTEEIRQKVSKAYIAPDFRGETTHLAWNYIPCRTMKNISYGHLGVTNSKAVCEFFNGDIGYNADPYMMFYDSVSKLNDFEMIGRQMQFVKDHHTYVNRVNELIEVADDYAS